MIFKLSHQILLNDMFQGSIYKCWQLELLKWHVSNPIEWRISTPRLKMLIVGAFQIFFNFKASFKNLDDSTFWKKDVSRHLHALVFLHSWFSLITSNPIEWPISTLHVKMLRSPTSQITCSQANTLDFLLSWFSSCHIKFHQITYFKTLFRNVDTSSFSNEMFQSRYALIFLSLWLSSFHIISYPMTYFKVDKLWFFSTSDYLVDTLYSMEWHISK